MKISTKGRYAIRVMLELGNYYKSEDPVTVKEISKRNDISDKYLEQIVSMLSKAGLIRSIRGAKGGHMLTHDPGSYSVADILKASEGNLSSVECSELSGEGCNQKDRCVSIRIWKKLDGAVYEVLNGIKLSDLLEWQSEQSDQYII